MVLQSLETNLVTAKDELESSTGYDCRLLSGYYGWLRRLRTAGWLLQQRVNRKVSGREDGVDDEALALPAANESERDQRKHNPSESEGCDSGL